MRTVSKRCRKCWKDDKETLRQQALLTSGFKEGNIPWNKGTKGLMSWSLETRKKQMDYRTNGGGFKGKKHTIKSRKITSEKLIGSQSPNWQGGITKLNKGDARKGVEWRIWKDLCFKRDDYTCRVCQKKGGKLVVHHIMMWSKYPKLRTKTNNGITLCKCCHKLVFHKEEQTEEFFKEVLSSKRKIWTTQLKFILSNL